MSESDVYETVEPPEYNPESSGIPDTEQETTWRPKLPLFYSNSQPRNPNFFGREDILRQLDDALLPVPESDTPASGGLRAFSLCSTAGLGKTQIALEYAHSRRSEFDVILWLPADEAVKLDDALAEIAVISGRLRESEAKDRVVAKNAVLDPDKINGVRWLMIFDNLDSRGLLRDYLPMNGEGSVLITSRDPFAKSYVISDSGVDLLSFEAQEANIFLQKLTYQSSTAEDAEDSFALAKRLNGFPLALVHVSGAINGKDLTFHECLKSYEAGSLIHKTEELALVHVGPYERTLSTAFALEYLSRPAKRLLEVIAFLDPDGLKDVLLEPSSISHTIPEYPSEDNYPDTRFELTKASLIKRDKQQRTLYVHRVVQDVVRDSLTKEAFEQRFMNVVLLISTLWEEDRTHLFGHRVADWREAAIVVAHILKLVSHYDRQKPNLSCKDLLNFVSLVNRASIYLEERNDWTTSLALAKTSLAILSQQQDPSMGYLHADVLFLLAVTYDALSDAENGMKYARQHFKQQILVEDAAGENGDLSFRAMAYTQLACASVTSGEFEEAILHAKMGRSLLEKTEEYKNDTYWPHWADWSHAWALIGLRRYDEALPLVVTTLQWRERHYGVDDTESMKTAYTLQILGGLKEHLGAPDEAVKLFERSLYLFRRTIGDSSYRANQVRVKLGEHYARLKRPESANLMFNEALKYFTGDPYYGAERARTLFKKSQFLRSLGEDESADQTYEEAEVLFYKLRREPQYRGKVLTAEDFDSIVVISSR
ncbi:hypothetical protein F5Y01DRAFT_322036 [Xylaria sp. FL0043]|nr:hypothetical protein F5Y01DRAFT_322036 [Xylaria sp. FL0043]